MAYALTKSPPLAAVSIEKLMAMLERYDPFCYGYNDALNYTLTNANIFLKDGTTAKFNANGSGLTFQQGDWEPIKIENDVLLELSFSNRTYTGEIPLNEELTNEYPNGLDPNKPDPFKNNSTTNRLLVILEEDNVDFSVAIDTGTGGYLVRALHGMNGGKVITILKQQATGVVDLENGDLDEIRRTYSLGTYLMVPTGTTVYPDAVGSTYEYAKTGNNRYELYPIGYPYLKGKVLYETVKWNENGTFDYVTDENDYMVGPNYNSYDIAGYIDVGSNEDELTWSMTVDDSNIERRYTMELKTLLTSKDNGNTWNVTTQQSSYDEFGSGYDPYVTTYFPKNKTRDVYLTLFSKEGEMPVDPGVLKPFNTVKAVGGDLTDTLVKKNILYICKDSDTLNYYCDIYGKVFTYGNDSFTEVGTYVADVNLNDDNALVTRKIKNIQIKLNDGNTTIYIGEGLNQIDPLSLNPADDGSDRIHAVFEKQDSYYSGSNAHITLAFVNGQVVNFKYHVVTGNPDVVSDV